MTRAERAHVQEMLEAFADEAVRSGLRFWGIALTELSEKEKLGALIYCAKLNLERNLEHGEAVYNRLLEDRVL